MVNLLMPSHMFGERGLMRMCARNATVAQSSTGVGKVLQLSGLDYQAVKAGRDPLAVQAKLAALRAWLPLRACDAAVVRDECMHLFKPETFAEGHVLYARGGAATSDAREGKLLLLVCGSVVRGAPASVDPAVQPAQGQVLDRTAVLVALLEPEVTKAAQRDVQVLLGTDALAAKEHAATIICRYGCKPELCTDSRSCSSWC